MVHCTDYGGNSDEPTQIWESRPKGQSQHRNLALLRARRVNPVTGANIDTTTANGRLIFGIFASLAEFEAELIRERTQAGLEAARARGRKGGRKHGLSKAQVRLAQAAMQSRDTKVSELCKELGITRVTLYRYISPDGTLRKNGQAVLQGS